MEVNSYSHDSSDEVQVPFLTVFQGASDPCLDPTAVLSPKQCEACPLDKFGGTFIAGNAGGDNDDDADADVDADAELVEEDADADVVN